MTTGLQWKPALRYKTDPIEGARDYVAAINTIEVFLHQDTSGTWLLSCSELHITHKILKTSTISEAQAEAEIVILDALSDKIMLYQSTKEALLG